jgi:hypothetical protein
LSQWIYDFFYVISRVIGVVKLLKIMVPGKPPK